MLSMRFWFAFRVWRTGERLSADRAALQRESLWAHVTGWLFFLLLAAVAVHLWILGGNLRKFAFPAPDWLRWAGLGLGIMSVGLFVWTHETPGTVLVPSPATSPRPQIDYSRSLCANPASDVFGDCRMVDEPRSGGGKLDSLRLCGAGRA